MKAFFLSVAALGLLAAPAGCHLLTDPANIEGALPAEANELRVIKASLTVTGAYSVLSSQLDKGLVTPAEARRIKTEIDKARDAVKVAAQAVEIGDMTTDAKLLALQSLLDALAREAILKGS